MKIDATSLEVTNNGGIEASTFGQGDGGNIKIEAGTSLEVSKGAKISTTAEGQQGSAGHIIINAPKVRLSQNGDITTFADDNAGNGGDITITADSILAFGDSDILAYSKKEIGGDITLKTPAFFGEGYYGTSQGSPQNQNNNNRVDLNASGQVSGGTISVPDVSNVQNGLTQLSGVSIDTDALIANSCLARSKKKQGSFVLIGTGGLPYSPGLIPSTGYPTTEVQSTPDSPDSGTTEDLKEPVEPLGVYQLESGEMILGRECQ